MNDDASLDSLLGQEILRSERMRSLILAGIFAAGALVYALALLFLSDDLERLSQGALHPALPFVVLGSFLVYELLMARVASRALAEERQPKAMARYLNAFIESSAPTLAMVVLSALTHPVYVILLPPAFVYFLGIALSALRLDPKLSAFTGLLSALQYLLVSMLAIHSAGSETLEPILIVPFHHIGKAMLIALTGAVTGVVSARIRDYLKTSLQTVADKKRVLDLFGQHVSPAVVDKLMSQGSAIASETRHVCVMFLDIRDFTRFSEDKKPEEVVAYLNGLWAFMIDIVNANHGIVNKFLGDGFMAVFGAPLSDGDDCRHAVRAAREIVQRTTQESDAGTLPTTRVGIGLHCGDVVTGEIGSARRKEYTIIGDVVNLTSRIEGLNKQHASMLLLSEAVRARAGDDAQGAVSLGSVQVKGRNEPVEIWKLA